ncbi:MAG: YcxB family protein [Ferruginibacter sp.]
MTFTFTLTENDLLQSQLFIASKTARIKRQRVKTWLVYSIAILLIGLMFYQSGNIVMTYYCLIFGIIFLCFFPLYQKSYYKKHYQRFIADTYKNRFGKTTTINFTEQYIETIDITGESKINLQEVENITETSNYFYVKMKTGGHLVIPKQKPGNIEQLRQEFKSICGKLSVHFIDDLTWRWK